MVILLCICFADVKATEKALRRYLLGYTLNVCSAVLQARFCEPGSCSDTDKRFSVCHCAKTGSGACPCPTPMEWLLEDGFHGSEAAGE